ncbi:MAG: hypothetical protein QW303_06130 [Nitrososphaerota archaeon]
MQYLDIESVDFNKLNLEHIKSPCILNEFGTEEWAKARAYPGGPTCKVLFNSNNTFDRQFCYKFFNFCVNKFNQRYSEEKINSNEYISKIVFFNRLKKDYWGKNQYVNHVCSLFMQYCVKIKDDNVFFRYKRKK